MRKRKYRTFTPEQKTEIVLNGLRGDRTNRDICREYGIAGRCTTSGVIGCSRGGKVALATPRDQGSDARDGALREAKKRIAQLEQVLDKRPTSWRSRGRPLCVK